MMLTGTAIFWLFVAIVMAVGLGGQLGFMIHLLSSPVRRRHRHWDTWHEERRLAWYMTLTLLAMCIAFKLFTVYLK